ncbi:AMP-binding protein [Basilea psittacipulmonis]|uniref:AMP-dependent synthetase/ligase domain-containing protein n=1 Tax=Basilea psittacipulmonis DSM 24701 TaxID=1072685 RepID=A0A077DFZ2_9BURK|nr:AMP-binding protein [Basilea psittacipulmonis]AIL32332.1 hypothetical protein IX83_02465 [Basilea psittacipulmonis DSM 24701]
MSTKDYSQYQSLYNEFEWLIPHNLNIAEMCCHRWAANPHEARRAAIFFEDQVGQLTEYSYKKLADTVTKLARGFLRMGVRPQDRILIITQHSAEAAVCVLAALTVGALAVPLPANLTSAQYQARFIDTQAKVAVIDHTTISNVMGAIDNASTVKQIIGIHTEDERLIQWRTLLARQDTHPLFTQTSASTPAILMYSDDPNSLESEIFTHSCLIGTLPGFVCSQNWYPQTGDIFWSNYGFDTPKGIIHALLPVLYFGNTIVGCPSGRTMPRLFNLLQHYQVTNILITAKELDRIKENITSEQISDYDINIRNIACESSDLSQDTKDWIEANLHTTINTFFSHPKAFYIAGDANIKWPQADVRSLGMPYPGHKLAIFNAKGKEVANGEVGDLHIFLNDKHDYPDPIISKMYWKDKQRHRHDYVDAESINLGIKAKFDEYGRLWKIS